MEPKTAADFDPQVLILFDAYVHGALDRRGFLDKAAKYAVGGVTAISCACMASFRWTPAVIVIVVVLRSIHRDLGHLRRW